MSSSAVEALADAPVPPPQRRPIPWPAFWVASVLGLVAAAEYLKEVLADRGALMHLTDLSVYRIAGMRVLDGISVYDTPLYGHTRGVWEFVYAPFSALLFAPLAKLDGDPLTYVGAIGNFAILALGVWAALAMLGYRRDLRLVVVSLPVAGLLLWIEPIRQTMGFGQVNILLMSIVLVDLALPDSSRVKGVLTGIAAGIKLTPVFFVLYLLFTRRYRAAAVSVGSLAATVVIGFLVLPHDSATFWSGAFADPTRVGVPENPDNESLRGLFARSIGLVGGTQLLWLAAAAVIALACLLLARRLSFAGEELLAVVLCGLTTTAVSPYSWVHHWVWLGALIIYLLHASLRPWAVGSWISLVLVFVVASGGVLMLFDYPESSILFFPSWGHLGVVYHNAYIWLTVVILLVVAIAQAVRRQDAVVTSEGVRSPH
ncbi:glycosyltransferase 87 family protein [Amycolatopsis taiwanensis]|uniref:glycosyltransferase 87 family protein n=1 Tax=Amycolatopsis taiwanensis TaxID=342230 RepID=UPI0006948FA2|nr:glycosyltransferase 87 family protein [Amycolatopsis taiwanensis]